MIVDDTSISVDAGTWLALEMQGLRDCQVHPKFNRDGVTMDLIMQHKGHIVFEQLMMHDRMSSMIRFRSQLALKSTIASIGCEKRRLSDKASQCLVITLVADLYRYNKNLCHLCKRRNRELERVLIRS